MIGIKICQRFKGKNSQIKTANLRRCDFVLDPARNKNHPQNFMGCSWARDTQSSGESFMLIRSLLCK